MALFAINPVVPKYLFHNHISHHKNYSDLSKNTFFGNTAYVSLKLNRCEGREKNKGDFLPRKTCERDASNIHLYFFRDKISNYVDGASEEIVLGSQS